MLLRKNSSKKYKFICLSLDICRNCHNSASLFISFRYLHLFITIIEPMMFPSNASYASGFFPMGCIPNFGEQSHSVINWRLVVYVSSSGLRPVALQTVSISTPAAIIAFAVWIAPSTLPSSLPVLLASITLLSYSFWFVS